MAIGTTKAKATDPSPQHGLPGGVDRRFPGLRGDRDLEPAALQMQQRIQGLLVERGRNLAVLHRQHHLQQPRNAGSRFQVANIGLDRSQPTAGSWSIGSLGRGGAR